MAKDEMLVSRRNIMKGIGAGAAALAMGGAMGGGMARLAEGAQHKGLPEPAACELAPLPYPANALEPHIDGRIVRLHHDKHQLGYVKDLNETLAKLEAARKAGDFTQVRALERDLAFNGSGALLHALYWNSMRPGGSGEPEGMLREAIERDFGSLDAFTGQFTAAAGQVQGSGWATLAYEPTGRRLLVLQVENHQDGTIWGCTPLMVCDVWEHAYYLQYENRRAEYVSSFMKLVDWQSTAARLEAALLAVGPEAGAKKKTGSW